jgi:hypothetical protein
MQPGNSTFAQQCCCCHPGFLGLRQTLAQQQGSDSATQAVTAQACRSSAMAAPVVAGHTKRWDAMPRQALEDTDTATAGRQLPFLRQLRHKRTWLLVTPVFSRSISGDAVPMQAFSRSPCLKSSSSSRCTQRLWQARGLAKCPRSAHLSATCTQGKQSYLTWGCAGAGAQGHLVQRCT